MRVAGLLFETVERDAAPINASGCAGLEPAQLETEGLQGFRQPLGGLFASAARRHALVAHPDLAAQEGAGGEDHGAGAVGAAEVGAHAGHPGTPVAVLAGGALHLQTRHHRFAQGQIRGVLQQLQHLAGVLAFVGLGAQGPHGRPPAGVEDAFL